MVRCALARRPPAGPARRLFPTLPKSPQAHVHVQTVHMRPTWLDRELKRIEEPWEAVDTAPAMVWSMYQEKAGSVQPAGSFQYL